MARGGLLGGARRTFVNSWVVGNPERLAFNDALACEIGKPEATACLRIARLLLETGRY